MLKYDFNNNNAIVDLPSIWKIGSGKISFITASGTDIADIPDNGEFTILVGNIDSIHIGGTEHWGYNKNIITLGNSESVEDDIYVDTITVSPSEADWCKCEKVGNKLVYTPIEANPTTEPRYAYFRHSTSDTYIKSGNNAGLFAAPEWWVTVKQLGSQHAGARPENLTDNTNPYIGGNGNIGEVEDFTQVHTPVEHAGVRPEGGSSSGGGSSSSNQGNVNVSISITNTLTRDAYITGHIHTAFLRPNPTQEQIANNDTWGYIYIDIIPETTGAAKYKIEAGETVVVPSSMLSITAKSPEVPSEYFGGGIFYEQDGETPAYWRLYSWTDNRDPALIKSTPENTTTFDNGGTLYFNIVKIRDDQNDTDYQGLMNGGIIPQDAILLSDYVTQQLNNNSGNEGGNSGSGSSSDGSKNVTIKLVNGRQDNVYLEAVHFYITPTLNVEDSYTTGNNTCHVRMEYNHTMAFNPGSSMTLNIDATGDIAWLQEAALTWGTPMDGERIYWLNGVSHDGGKAVVLYNEYRENSHNSELYHANPLSGEIQFNHEYTFTIY